MSSNTVIPIVYVTLASISFLTTLSIGIYSMAVGQALYKQIKSAAITYLGLCLIGAATEAISFVLYYIATTLSQNADNIISAFSNLIADIGMFMHSQFVLVQISYLCFDHLGIAFFQMPLRKCMNPNRTQNYWTKIILVILSVYVVGGIAQLIMGIAEQNNSSPIEVYVIPCITLLLGLVDLYLNILQMTGAFYFSQLIKKQIISMQMGVLQITLACINTITSTINDVFAIIQLCLSSNTYVVINGIATSLLVMVEAVLIAFITKMMQSSFFDKDTQAIV